MKKNGKPMITPAEALELVLKHASPLDEEHVELFDAAGRVLAGDIISGINIPPFDNSAMDGYAVASAVTRGASSERPVALTVTGEVRAGVSGGTLPSAESAVRIMTGAPVPSGCDAVVPVEDTAEENGRVLIKLEARPGDHIRRAGEDLALGAKALCAGRRLTPADAGILASLGVTAVPVRRRPLVGIISTGDELVDPGAPLGEGQIRNSNAYTLHGEILKCGARPLYLGIARDTPEKTKRLFADAEQCDVIVTTGGVSMGLYDFVPGVLRELGIAIIFETIRMKPGKPCVFGARGNRLYFGLPGNPVSTLVSFIQFVRPALLALMGARLLEKPLVSAVLGEPVSKKKGRAHYLRGFFTLKDGVFHVTSTGPQGSGMLRSMSDANCLIILPEGMEKARAGDRVTIQLINHDEAS